MDLVVISDIFGRTPALESLCAGLRKTARIIDPYNGRDLLFDTEDAAYAHFIRHVGLDSYTRHIEETLSPPMGDTFIIAFSVGASCVWRLSAQAPDCRVRKAVCFYGSQIRHCPDLTPEFDIELIFPQKEPCFDVDDLATQLQVKDRVTCRKAAGLHGFMNERSLHFDSGLKRSYIEYLNRQLRTIY